MARKVIRAAQDAGVDRETSLRNMDDESLDAWIKARMYDPHSEVHALEREVGALLSNLGPASPALNGYVEDQSKDAKL